MQFHVPRPPGPGGWRRVPRVQKMLFPPHVMIGNDATRACFLLPMPGGSYVAVALWHCGIGSSIPSPPSPLPECHGPVLRIFFF